uniref:DUF455 domain-containing protein n=1 Tax=Arcella intermedia TaxID=1963864 RepID=A0A6B2LDH2_9EUKA
MEEKPSEVSLVEYAVQILSCTDTDLKASQTFVVAELWRNSKISKVGHCTPPAVPGRPDLTVLPPNQTARKNLISMVHALVHIESVAIDLAWDIIARYTHYDLPNQFYDDFVLLAEEEAKHYSLLRRRIKELGSDYGALPVHNGLWESATRTAEDLYARLAVEHMVHEARGLDITPKTIQRFRKAGDNTTADLLEATIYPEEITHVAKGLKWFSYLCQRESPPKEPVKKFIALVPNYFKGSLKPPFNGKARAEGGMTEEWYLPLVNSKLNMTSDSSNQDK